MALPCKQVSVEPEATDPRMRKQQPLAFRSVEAKHYAVIFRNSLYGESNKLLYVIRSYTVLWMISESETDRNRLIKATLDVQGS